MSTHAGKSASVDDFEAIAEKNHGDKINRVLFGSGLTAPAA